MDSRNYVSKHQLPRPTSGAVRLFLIFNFILSGLPHDWPLAQPWPHPPQRRWPPPTR